MLFLVALVLGVTTVNGADQVRQAPQRLRGGDHGVGLLAPKIQFRDLSRTSYNLGRLAKDHRAVVVVMTSTSCPLSRKYFPTLLELSNRYAKRDVHFVFVNSVPSDKIPSMKAAKRKLGDRATYVFDKSGTFADSIGVETTTDTMLIDRDRTIVYHGAVDDQYGFGYSLEKPRKRYLVDALEALLRGRTPAVEATVAPGCQLAHKKLKPTTTASNVTYHNRISRLINRHCVTCHREGAAGPFALDTYRDLQSHGPMIREVVQRGTMPPWFAAKEEQSKASRWANDASMTAKEREDLIGWIEGDQDRGKIADAPEPRAVKGIWQIGEPDVIYEFPKAIAVQATGVMPYQYVAIQTSLTEDKWVQAVELVPGESSVVHHVLVFAQPPGRKIEDAVNYWAGYAPGTGSRTYPQGYARRLPRGAKLVFQMHYTPNGTATHDKTKIGLRFSDTPPQYEVKTASVINTDFAIPPGAKNQKVVANLRVPREIRVLGYLAHYHLRGAAGRFELVGRGDQSETLLDMPAYDFNWQLFYRYANPPIFPRGSTIRYTAWYDNSEYNPANPNPNATVRWGPQTHDEMHIGYVEYALPSRF